MTVPWEHLHSVRGREASITPISFLIAAGESFAQDLRFAARRLWRSRGFAIVALLMLAVGIGVNSAVFTVANSALFKGFPLVHENDRILYLTTTKNAVSYPDYQDWQSQARSFEQHRDGARGVHHTQQRRWSAGNVLHEPSHRKRLYIAWCKADLSGATSCHQISTLGHARRDSPQRPLAKSLCWESIDYRRDDPAQRRADRRYRRHAGGHFRSQKTRRCGLRSCQPKQRSERETFYARYAFGRLAQGATREAPTRRWRPSAASLRSTYPNTNSNRSPVMHDFREFFIGDNGTKTYKALWGAVGLVLLIASGNVANLLLNRSIRRSRDISVRLALGAGRGQVVRLIVLESVLLSGVAGLSAGGSPSSVCVRTCRRKSGAVTAVLSYTADANYLATP